MRKTIVIKIIAVGAVLTIGLVGFSLSLKSEVQSTNQIKTYEETLDDKLEVAGYKNWTKVNDKPQIMWSEVAALCRMPTEREIENDIHNNKYINVYVNSLGKDEMMTKKKPLFPQGTIIVKEKLSTPDSKTPELLTVMIKRDKGYNPENGDWEYMTLNGGATEISARGKLVSCQRCHAADKSTDYVSRKYLPDEVWKKLK
jgi:hypothetical protein